MDQEIAIKEKEEPVEVAAGHPQHNHRWDQIGIFASALCLVHCLAIPVILSLMPVVGARLFEHEMTHEIMAFIILPVALLAFVPGYRRHRDITIFIPAVIGLILIILGAFVIHELADHVWEIPVTIAGGITLIYAHLRNRKLCKCCNEPESCDHDHGHEH